MNMLLNLESPVTTAHRAKLAYIYVRQSTPGQVRQHQESTELQYRLVDRAALFGWPKERIEVIDDDLGKSGTPSDTRGCSICSPSFAAAQRQGGDAPFSTGQLPGAGTTARRAIAA